MSSAPALPLILMLLCSGCASMRPRLIPGVNPRYTARETAGWVSASTPMIADTLAAQLAFQGAVRELSRFTRRAHDELSRLHDGHLGRTGRSAGPFAPHIEYGERQLRWMETELTAATRLADTASDVEDVTGRSGAGMSEPPRHHVLPKEFREWFERRGFTGEMDIDRFCVEMQQAHHEAIHGGGNWRLGRTWPGEWNRMIMEALLEPELDAGRMLSRNEILKIVASYMKRYKLPMNFVSWRAR